MPEEGRILLHAELDGHGDDTAAMRSIVWEGYGEQPYHDFAIVGRLALHILLANGTEGNFSGVFKDHQEDC